MTKTVEGILKEKLSTLSPKEQDFLLQDNVFILENELSSVVESIKKQTPADLIPLDQISFTIPAQSKSIVDPIRQLHGDEVCEEFVRKTFENVALVSQLLKEYPETQETKIRGHHLSKDVIWYAFTKSLGDLTELRKHALTPKQVEWLFERIGKINSNERMEFLFFMEGLKSLNDNQYPAMFILRIFVAEKKKDDYMFELTRYTDWNFVGYIYPLEAIDKNPPMHATGSFKGYDIGAKNIILLREG